MLKNCAKLHAAHAACLYFSSFNQSDHCFLGSLLPLRESLLKLPIICLYDRQPYKFKTPQVDIFSNVTANTPCLSQIGEITMWYEEKVHVTFPFAAQMAISSTLHCKNNRWQSTAFLTPGTFS